MEGLGDVKACLDFEEGGGIFPINGPYLQRPLFKVGKLKEMTNT